MRFHCYENVQNITLALAKNGAANKKRPSYFRESIWQPHFSKSIHLILWFVIFIAITMLIVLLGVEKGIERVSKIMMPVLAVLSLFIAVYVMFIDGAWQGVVYYIKPDFSRFSFMTVVAAMGQLFYSMSLAMGIMITYGSYMKKDVNLEKSVHSIEIFDMGIAFFAGLMIIPAVFAFSGGDEASLGKGPGLMFITLPKVFGSMVGGQIIGTLFFLLVLFAALTVHLFHKKAVNVGNTLLYPGSKYLAESPVIVYCYKAEIRAVNRFIISADAVIVTDKSDFAVRKSVFLAPKIKRIVFVEGLGSHIEG